MYRSHRNHELNIENLDQKVTLCGWVATMRDHGGVNFIDLRDRWGCTQLVFNPDVDAALHNQSQDLRSEYCIGVEGLVKRRPEGTVNQNLPTGEIEIEVQKLTVYSSSKTPPFPMDLDVDVSEEIRLKHRYLDLRRSSMQNNLEFRSKLIHAMRDCLQKDSFVEIDTPVLTKSTPEGARDYLVPSRVHEESFFALPQSPQLFKQILMVSGFDRYFQIAKCFRDEDLRADRQPEFTQIDMEMSFVEEKDVFSIVESMLSKTISQVLDREIPASFKRLNYCDAMKKYGSDKPDLRFDMELREVTHVFKDTSLKIFKQTIEGGGVILALHVPKPSKTFSRKDYDDLIAYAKECGAGGLAYLKYTESGIESPIAKFFTEEEVKALNDSLPQEPVAGDVVFFAADKESIAQSVLGAIRLRLGQDLNLIDHDKLEWLWVHNFPLFKYNSDEGRWDSEHHPFTSPHPEDIDKLGDDNGSIRSMSYDLVLNGSEIASGSVRIHDAVVQKKIFEIIGLEASEAQKRFGFLLRAFEYGPPPHAGIALGLDRLLAILLKMDSIREVIAFPKTQKALCPLTEAPSEVDSKQLRELGIRSL